MYLRTRLKALFDADMYHGWNKKKRFFEGWYYKIVCPIQTHLFAIIPGIAMDDDGFKHAFIQVLDGANKTSQYFKFPFESFSSSTHNFEVYIGNNFFSKNKIKIDLPILTAELEFCNTVAWPSSFFSPGIMGPFSFFPFMECYHGIVSLNHTIYGSVCYNNQVIDFNNGKGYIEKDWGHSFPMAYFWMQSNHFNHPGISVKASIANIPWLGTSFVGFIAGVWIEGKLVQFTTYNFSKLNRSFADEKQVIIELENSNYRLEINASRDNSTELAAPIAGFMNGKINESMTDKMFVKLFDKKKNILILNDVGESACVEVAGKIKNLFKVG